MTRNQNDRRGPGAMDYRAKAREAFDAIQEDGPVDVPRWDDLHRIEQDHLVRFAAELLRRHQR